MAATAVVRDVHAADGVFQQIVLKALGESSHFCNAEDLLAWAIRAARHSAIDLTSPAEALAAG